MIRLKICHRTLLRFGCILLSVVLLGGTVTVWCGSGQQIAVSVPEASAGGVRLNDAFDLAVQAAGSVPYVADASMDELRGIITYAVGGNPTEGKALDEAGQNTKNNVAISLLWLFKSLKGAYSLRCVLEPYPGADNVYEMCAYVRRIFGKGEECIHTGWLYDRTNRRIYTADSTGMMGIGYDFNYEFNTFFAAGDPWQRNFGFCRMYDGAAFMIGDVYETIRIPFRYGDKDWIVQVWKGVYSWDMLGGEIGLYNKPIDREAAFYDCASDPERLNMSFEIRLGDETIVRTEPSLSWWETAFTMHRLTIPRNLTMEFTMTFPNKAMLNAFRDSLQTVAPNVEIQQNGLTLCCLWPSGK